MKMPKENKPAIDIDRFLAHTRGTLEPAAATVQLQAESLNRYDILANELFLGLLCHIYQEVDTQRPHHLLHERPAIGT
jgi:hypothetical protein